MRIAFRLGLALAAASAVPAGVAGLFSTQLIHDSLLSQGTASTERAARSASRLLDQRLLSLSGRLQGSAQAFDLDVQFSPQQLEAYALHALRAAPEVSAVLLLNHEGRLVLPEPVLAPGTELSPEELANFLRYVRLGGGETAVLGGVFPRGQGGAPLAVFTVERTARAGGGEDLGWAVAWLVDLALLQQELEEAVLHPGEALWVLDGRQRMIFSPAGIHLPDGDAPHPLFGAGVIGASAELPKLGWTVRVTQPSAQALAPSGRMRGRTVVVLLLSLVTGLLTAAALARGIAGPMRELSRAASRLAAGQPGTVPVRGSGELAELATSFNAMAAEVSRSAAELQLRVDQRTAELARSKEAVEKTNDRLQLLSNNLARFLPAQFVDKLMTTSHTGEFVRPSHRRVRLTIAFADLVGFTDASDQLEPEQLTRVVNSFFEDMTAIAEAHGGTVAKFMGDAVMVFFGDPQFVSDEHHARQCVKMAVTMQQRIRELSREWAHEGIESPPRLRIGINTGYAAVGLFGSGARAEYTAIGRQVNLASRLQVACQPDEIILSHATYTLVYEQVDAEPMGEVSVRGIARPVSMFKVIRVRPASAAG